MEWLLETGLPYLVINTKRYSPLRGLTSSSCEWLWLSAKAFFALWAKKGPFTPFVLILGPFWCSVVTLSSNFEYNHFFYVKKFKKR